MLVKKSSQKVEASYQGFDFYPNERSPFTFSKNLKLIGSLT